MKKAVNIILKIIAVILPICMILLLWASCNVLELFHEGKFRLSAMHNWLCKQFLLDQGVTIPEEYSDMNFQSRIARFEEGPRSDPVAGSPSLEALLQEIKDAVNAYYGIEPIEPIVPVLPPASP